MTAISKKAMAGWLSGAAVAAVAAILAVSAYYLLGMRGPELPQADLSAMEPQVAERIRAFGDQVKAAPDSARAWGRLAQVFHAHDLFPPAMAAYAKAMELNPDDSRWPYLAALAEAKSDTEAAMPLFRRAVELRPRSPAVYINFGENLLRLGRAAEAEAAFRQALEMDKASSHALYGLAQVALINNDPVTAVSLLERAIAIAPRHGEIYGGLAQAYQRLGNKDAALRYSELARAWPDKTRAPDPVSQAMEDMAVSAQAIALKGVSLAKRGDYVAAEAEFRQALEIRPDVASYHSNLGGALAGQGQVNEALLAYRQGLAIDSSNADLLNNIGYTYMQTGRFDEAEKHLKAALDSDPGFAAALGNLGLLAERQQESKQQAIDYFEQALALNPGLLFARNALASRLATEGEVNRAIDEWRKVLEFDPNDLAAIHNIAVALAGIGQYADAIDYLRRGMQIAPNSSRLVAALAWQLATAPDDELRNGPESKQLGQRVYTAYPNQPQIIDTMAAALAETGDFDNAVKLMEPLAALEGDDAKPFSMRLQSYRDKKPWRQTKADDVTASRLVSDR